MGHPVDTANPGPGGDRLRVASVALGVLVIVSLTAGVVTYRQRTADGRVLRGRTFLSQSVTHDGQQRADVKIYLEFHDDGRLSGSAGCNTLQGDVTVRGGRLRLPEFGMTAMGCPDRDDHDGLVANLLGDAPAYKLEGDRLTVWSDRTTVVLLDREVADPDRPLVGRTWRLETYYSGPDDDDIAMSSRGATLRFEPDRVTYQVEGCGKASGPAEIGERTIRLSATYARATPECDGYQREVEGRVTGVLQGEVTYEIDSGQLTITHADGEGLVFHSDD